MTFEAWIARCFDHPEGDRDWWVEDLAPPPPPVVLAEHLARLFERPAWLLERFTPTQVDQGLWYLGGGGSGYLLRAVDDAVPVPLQHRWVRAIGVVYRELFAPHCAEFYGHLDRGPEPAHPLNASCYMWWDRDGLEQAAVARSPHARAHLVDPIFAVLADALALPSVACRESALHGLGHLKPSHPDRVRRLVDAFTAQGGHPPELVRYAAGAREGRVL